MNQQMVNFVKDNARRASALVAVLTGAMLAGVGAASATTPPSIETQISDGFGDIQTLVVATIAVAMFLLVGAVLGLRVGVKWLKRGASN